MYFCSRQVCFKEMKIKLFLLNLKHGARRSHSEACSLKKMHTTLYLFCFQMSCVVFRNQKREDRKSLNTFSSSANILKLFLGLIVSFGALMCKFGNKNVFLMLWHFLWNFFRFSNFQHLQKMGIFNFSLNRFRNDFWSYHTHYQTLSDCANSKS